jgi:hypothetical protein
LPSEIESVAGQQDGFVGTEPDKPTTGPQAIIIPGFAAAFAQDIADVNGNFKVDAGVQLDVPPLADMENMPWAINIAGTYVTPLPGEFIVKGHLKFRE